MHSDSKTLSQTATADTQATTARSTESRPRTPPADTLDDLFHAPIDPPPEQPTADGAGGSTDGDSEALIQTALRLLREHLELDVAFISHLTDAQRIFRHVDAGDAQCPVRPGGSDPREQSYCGAIVNGDLPEFIPDPAEHPVSAAMPVTRELSIGTYLGVPITFADGTVYGTLCAFSHEVRPARSERDLGYLKALASMIAGQVERAEMDQRRAERAIARLRGLRVGDDLKMVFQPIVTIASGRTIGFEALARFPDREGGPAGVFDEAARLGIGAELEIRAAQAAFARLDQLPDDCYLAVNVSPETLGLSAFLERLAALDAARIVVEITEHAAVRDYEHLQRSIAEIRRLNARLAIDDVGAGFSGLNHILRLEPDLLKMDGELVEGIDTDPARRAMAAALVSYARHTGTGLIAERIETAAERQALIDLGVACGQGYHFAKPAEYIR